MPKQHKYTSKNTTCRDAGHDWLLVGAYWRGCQRDHCRACEHFVNGRWVDAAPFYRRHVPVETDGTRPYLRQHGLWQGETSTGRTQR